jgi:hypothetical protein
LIDKQVYAIRQQMSDDLIHDYGKEIFWILYAWIINNERIA